METLEIVCNMERVRIRSCSYQKKVFILESFHIREGSILGRWLCTI